MSGFVLCFLLILVLSIGGLSSVTGESLRHHCANELTNILDNALWKSVNMTSFNERLKQLKKILEPLNTPVSPIEGGSGDHAMQLERELYYTIAQSKCYKTICEIGFNGGHSALLWLMANPTANVVMFDIWEHDYSKLAWEFIQSQKDLNPSRITIVKGRSQQSVRTYHTENPKFRCDLISVDGSHKHEDAVADIDNMMKLANRKWNVLFIDDTNCDESYCVDKAIEEHLIRGNIRVLDGYNLLDRGVSVLQYLNSILNQVN